ncbi:hypothetical protein H4Q26_015144 [Puccinia striiformis f. sp. tritici PST-130]|nr:hypothetical protein H4Q26_015144 [Puccinia striiformis f. sp. tritici PST-130]
MNSGILQEIKCRDDDEEEEGTINIKLISLEVLEEIWKEIALEESNGGIDQAAKKVVKRIELEIGESIEGYLS